MGLDPTAIAFLVLIVVVMTAGAHWTIGKIRTWLRADAPTWLAPVLSVLGWEGMQGLNVAIQSYAHPYREPVLDLVPAVYLVAHVLALGTRAIARRVKAKAQ